MAMENLQRSLKSLRVGEPDYYFPCVAPDTPGLEVSERRPCPDLPFIHTVENPLGLSFGFIESDLCLPVSTTIPVESVNFPEGSENCPECGNVDTINWGWKPFKTAFDSSGPVNLCRKIRKCKSDLCGAKFTAPYPDEYWRMTDKLVVTPRFLGMLVSLFLNTFILAKVRSAIAVTWCYAKGGIGRLAYDLTPSTKTIQRLLFAVNATWLKDRVDAKIQKIAEVEGNGMSRDFNRKVPKRLFQSKDTISENGRMNWIGAALTQRGFLAQPMKLVKTENQPSHIAITDRYIKKKIATPGAPNVTINASDSTAFRVGRKAHEAVADSTAHLPSHSFLEIKDTVHSYFEFSVNTPVSNDAKHARLDFISMIQLFLRPQPHIEVTASDIGDKLLPMKRGSSNSTVEEPVVIGVAMEQTSDAPFEIRLTKEDIEATKEWLKLPLDRRATKLPSTGYHILNITT